MVLKSQIEVMAEQTCLGWWSMIKINVINSGCDWLAAKARNHFLLLPTSSNSFPRESSWPTPENTQPVPFLFYIKICFLNFLSVTSLQTRSYQQLLFLFLFCFQSVVSFCLFLFFSVSRLYLFEKKKKVCCLKKKNTIIVLPKIAIITCDICIFLFWGWGRQGGGWLFLISVWSAKNCWNNHCVLICFSH